MSTTNVLNDVEYDESVARFAKKRMNMEFNNKGVSHAVTVVKNLLDTAENSVKMFSEQLNSTVADNHLFLESLKKYIESGKTFELLLEKIPDKQNRSKALNMVLEYSSKSDNNVKHKIISADSLRDMGAHFSNKDKIAYHFIVVDNRAFRVETDPQEFKATCNFNDPDVAGAFSKLFDKYFKEA